MDLVACSECDLLQRLPVLPPGSNARCRRCGSIVARQPADPIDRPLALALAAAVVFVVANTSPLMGLSAVGRHASTTIAGGAYEMWLQGEKITAAIVAFCAIIAPGSYILFMLTVLLAVRRPPAPGWIGDMLRWVETMQPWSMNEVMMLGILVALIKIAELATVEPGVGMYAVVGLVLLLPAIGLSFDAREAWKRIAWANGGGPPPAETRHPVANGETR